jgi:hypothetical protein
MPLGLEEVQERGTDFGGFHPGLSVRKGDAWTATVTCAHAIFDYRNGASVAALQ